MHTSYHWLQQETNSFAGCGEAVQVNGLGQAWWPPNLQAPGSSPPGFCHSCSTGSSSPWWPHRAEREAGNVIFDIISDKGGEWPWGAQWETITGLQGGCDGNRCQPLPGHHPGSETPPFSVLPCSLLISSESLPNQ